MGDEQREFPNTGGLSQAEAAEGFRQFAELLRDNTPGLPEKPIVMWSAEPDGSYDVGARVRILDDDGERGGTVTASD